MTKKITLLVLSLLTLVGIVEAQDWSEINKVIPSPYDCVKINYNYGNSVSIDGDYAVLGTSDAQTDNGYAYVLFNNAGIWETVAQLTATDWSANDEFGKSVCISGDNIIVGAPGNGNNGSAYVFAKPDEGWTNMTQTAKLSATDCDFDDFFGNSVSISGDNIVVGCPYNDNDNGAAYVFTKPDGGWVNMTQTAKLTVFGDDDYFGKCVSISGDNIVIGALSYFAGNTSVYIFTMPEDGWIDMSQTAKLTPSDGANYDDFGGSVCISGDNVIVGAANDDYKGSVYVFTKPNEGWENMTQTAKLTSSDGASDDHFGSSLCISGDNIIVGAYKDDDNDYESGSAYVFTKPTEGWINMTQTAKLTASDGAYNDYFGESVSISGDNIIVGAIYDDASGSNSGSVYIFAKPSTGWTTMTQTQKKLNDGLANNLDYMGESVSIYGDYAVVGSSGYNYNQGCAYVLYNNAGNWETVAQLTASDGVNDDYFGSSVSIFGDNIVVGCPYKDNGSAYVFSKPDGGWTSMTQTAKLIASDGDSNDYLGRSVSIYGNDIVVGGYGKNYYTGSAYVFTKPDEGWADMTETAKLTASDSSENDHFGYSVSISGDNIVVGSYNNNDIGSAYVFTKPDEGWADMSQTAKLTTSESLYNNCFGISVSISGDIIVVGDPCYNVNSYGGVVYLYVKPNDGWINKTQNAKILPPNDDNNRDFGDRVSIRDNYVVIGAAFDNNNGQQTGAVYVFAKAGASWYMVQTAKLVASDGNYHDFFGGSVDIYHNNIIVGAYGNDDNGFNTGSAYIFSYQKPFIYIQPENKYDVCIGSNISYTIGAENISTYQWQQNINNGNGFTDISDNNIYSGALTPILNIAGVTDEMDGYKYRCFLTGDEETDSSFIAVLRIDTEDPGITCVENKTITLNEGETFYTVQGIEFDPIDAFDNCEIASVENDFNNSSTLSGSQIPEGITNIIWTITDVAGNENTCSFDVTVNAFVGIETLEQSGISIYPNPTTGIINFEFTQNNIQKLTISDITCKQIFEKADILQNETIDLSSFSNGVYIISIQTDKEMFTTKIIKE